MTSMKIVQLQIYLDLLPPRPNGLWTKIMNGYRQFPSLYSNVQCNKDLVRPISRLLLISLFCVITV